MDYEPGLCDLVRVIDLTLIALVEPEADARIRSGCSENALKRAGACCRSGSPSSQRGHGARGAVSMDLISACA